MSTMTRLSIIDSHTAGEPTRMIVSGYPKIEGDTMVARLTFLESHLDWVRCIAMHEPRGHRDMFGCVLMPAVDPSAHIGAVYMDGGRSYSMCGHASLGICAMLVETGQVPPTGRSTKVRIDTPAGLIEGTVTTDEQGEIESVSLVDVPSFALALDVTVDVPGFGQIRADISYGGNIFVIAEAQDLGFSSIDPHYTDALIQAGIALRQSANEQLQLSHPELLHLNRIDIAMLTAPPSGPHADGRNIVLLGDAQADRSPCGTGTCARLAVKHAKGELALGEVFRHESSIRTVFDARVLGLDRVGSYDAIIPEISCRPFITGYNTLVVDPADPLKHGFTLGISK